MWSKLWKRVCFIDESDRLLYLVKLCYALVLIFVYDVMLHPFVILLMI